MLGRFSRQERFHRLAEKHVESVDQQNPTLMLLRQHYEGHEYNPYLTGNAGWLVETYLQAKRDTVTVPTGEVALHGQAEIIIGETEI